MRISRAAPLALWLAVAAGAADPPPELTPEKIEAARYQLRLALAGPTDEAFRQVLVGVDILRDTAQDTVYVYDLVARFDPERYRNPRVGLYPLTFEDQFIHWGKRVGVYTRSTFWRSGRFHLHDVASSRQAWISTADTRRLYAPSVRWPAPVTKEMAAKVFSPEILPDGFRPWLRLIHATRPGTDLRRMSRWIGLMNDEPREAVLRPRTSPR